MKRLLLLTMLLVATATFSAQAAVITRTFDVIGSNFADGGTGVASFDPVRIAFTGSMDPADFDQGYAIYPLVIHHITLPGDLVGSFGYDFFSNVGHAVIPSYGFFLQIDDPFGNAVPSLMYYRNNVDDPNAFLAQSLELVPEPASLALLSMGLLGLAALRRRD